MAWYRAGTVSCTQNSTTVTGTGTAFAANARVGDAFMGPDGRWYEVVNVASDTVLSIQPAYLGATVAVGTYALAPMQGYVKDSADALRTLVNKFGALAANLADYIPDATAISGLIPSWNSSSSMTFSSGSAALVTGAKINVAAAITVSGLTGLATSSWYYAYLYLNGSVAQIELVTTAPSSPYLGSARSKTGDTSRRFLGAFRTNTSGGLMRFDIDASNIFNYQEDVTVAPLLVLSAGAAQAATVVSLSSVVPVTTRTAKIAVINTGTPTAFIYPADALSSIFFSQSAGGRASIVVPTNASQQIAYGHGNATGAALYIDVQGYGMDR